MDLDIRLSAGPVYGQTHVLGDEQVDPWAPETSNVVNLKSNGIYILAKILTVKEDIYTGQIMGFENQEPAFEDKQLGDMIEFRYEHIFVINR